MQNGQDLTIRVRFDDSSGFLSFFSLENNINNSSWRPLLILLQKGGM